MKLIIAVTFIGILMHVFAENKCTLDPPAKNYDSGQYWDIVNEYVTYSKNNPEMLCRKYTTQNSKDKSITTITSKYTTGGNTYNNEYQCENKEIEGSNGQFTADCKVVTGTAKTTPVQLQISIVATDNKDNSIIHICYPDGTDNFLVMQTNKDGVPPTDVTKEFKEDLKTWLSKDNVNCENLQDNSNIGRI